MSANDLINFWDPTISKWPFNGNFEFCNIYLIQEMQNDWTMNIKQNVGLMSHTRITHDKFHTKKIQNGCQSAIFLFLFFINFCIFFFTISEIVHDSWSMNSCFFILRMAIIYLNFKIVVERPRRASFVFLFEQLFLVIVIIIIIILIYLIMIHVSAHFTSK